MWEGACPDSGLSVNASIDCYTAIGGKPPPTFFAHDILFMYAQIPGIKKPRF
ncbi:hypothetical protein C8K58_106138 [Pseudomonas sp. GV047]|nr:hypothetical protein C8K58_106138 [Pseudomonas sp. GV047]